MGAGPVPEILHRVLNALAWLVKRKALPTLSPFAPLMHRAINVLRWGEHRGGMFVEIEGAGPGGEPTRRSWHMIAEGDDGPFIPSMAPAAVVRRCLEGRPPMAGARAATGELEVADYDAAFARKSIYSGVREANTGADPLYRRVLGDAWQTLPEPVRAMHDFHNDRVAEGRATVERGEGFSRGRSPCCSAFRKRAVMCL
jgi:hypothetical protein